MRIGSWLGFLVGGLSVLGLRPVPPAATTWVSEPAAGVRPWLHAIADARHAIDLNAYLLTDGPLIHALKAAANRGVTVRILLEPHPYRAAWAPPFTRARLAGSKVVIHAAPARFAHPYAFDHAKYLVVDPGDADQVALFGSANGTASAFEGGNLDDALETTQPAVVQALTQVFDADWAGHRAGRAPRRVLTLSPGAAPALAHLFSAPGPVAVMTEELGPVPRLDAGLAQHGGQARVLVPMGLSRSDRQEATALVCAGVHVRHLATPTVHAKLIVTATATWVGSQNLSPVSLDANREVGLITTSAPIHQQVLGWFNHWWAQATPQPRPVRCVPGGA